MDREEIRKDILKLKNKAVLLELPTGIGKSKIGMELCLQDSPNSILIIVPRIVLIQNWKEEFKKWGKEKYLSLVTFSTYAGLHKIQGHFDCIICDEAHHITPRIQELLSYITFNRIIMLSATVTKNLKYELQNMFPGIYCYKIGIKEAIQNEVLPDPIVYLLPLTLDNKSNTEEIVKNKKGEIPITCAYKDRWKYIKNKKYKVTIKCTPSEKSSEFDTEVFYWKNRYMRTRNEVYKNRWLYIAGQRLKWLSNQKNAIVKELLNVFKNERVLTFCSSIEQTALLGKNCINSKNKNAIKILESFNNGEINHITACNMLNEGINLSNCRIGIYANLNSSDIIIKQRLGRILRHKNPAIIIPYFKNTREVELVNKMLEDYNPQLIYKVKQISDTKL